MLNKIDVLGCRGRDWAQKTSNMADSIEWFELESFAIKKVETFAEFPLDTN